MKRFGRLLTKGFKLVVGGLLCQHLLTSVLAIGFAYRFMRRTAQGVWQPESPDNESSNPAWPNWAWPEPDASTSGSPRGWAQTIRANARLGFAGLLTTCCLTLPPLALCNLSWYAGWNNSFHKGYEYAAYGPLLGILGVVLFMMAMLHVPLGQARHAVTGDWKTFFDFGLIQSLVRQRPIAVVLLAGCYAISSVPIMVLKTAPLFIEDIAPQTIGMSAAELLAYLNAFYLRVALIGFATYLWLRWLAARLYARALMSAVSAGAVPPDALSAIERAQLQRAGVDGPYTPHRPSRLQTIFMRTVRMPLTTLVLACWFAFVAQIYVSEFLNYHPMRGWLNQPLVQAPWYRYVPRALEQAAKTVGVD